MKIELRDSIRRWVNLLLPFGQIVLTILAFYRGTSFEQATENGIPDPPVVPAGYAFVIWSLIYAGCVVYGIYQFQPSRTRSPLLRRIGPSTAVAFMATCAWLVAARFAYAWATVLLIFCIAAALWRSFRTLWEAPQMSLLERRLVLTPISIFAGWISVAVFANAASVIKAQQWRHFLLSETGWAVVTLCAAGVLVSLVLRRSGGNLCYAATVLWALLGIAARNFAELRNPVVAWTAISLAFVVVLVMTGARRKSGMGSVGGDPKPTSHTQLESRPI